METQAEPAKKNEDMKSKKDENEKKEKGGGGEAAARENLETSGTQFAKIAHQLFSHLLEFKVCFQERRSIHIREGPNTTSDLLYRNALLSKATNFSNEMNKETRIDLRFLAALVSMLARKPFLSNLHSSNSESWCQYACNHLLPAKPPARRIQKIFTS